MRTALILLVLAFSTSAATAGEELIETIDRNFSVTPGSSFKIDNVNGSITVSGWDHSKVKIRATKRVTSRDANAAQQAMKALRIEIRHTSRSLEVDTHYPKRDDLGMIERLFGGATVNAMVKYEVQVPRSMDLSVDTVNGAIRVSDVSGQIELDTTNGKIEVQNCSGSVEASTTNGAIGVELLAVTPGKDMRFETTNGRITLAVPRSLSAEINASTTNGSVRTDLPVTTSRVSRTSIRGTLNGGGPEIRLRTTNGAIDIKPASMPPNRS